MTRYVALFRGINVGKAKRIAMADLRALLEAMGYANVQTLLNSGNAVFDARAAGDHAARIRSAVEQRFGVNALVVAKSAQEMAAIVRENPLAVDDPSRLLVAFTRDARSLAALAALGLDDLHVGKHAAYAWCRDGILASDVGTALLRELEGRGTTRNWGTTRKLAALASP